MSDEHRPGDDLADQLSRIETTMQAVLEEQRRTNGRLRQADATRIQSGDDLYGPEEERRARHKTGLMGQVDEALSIAKTVRRSRDDSSAIASAMKWIIPTCIAMVTMMVAALTLLMRLTGIM